MFYNNSKEVESNLLPLYLKNKRLGKIHSKFKNGFNIQFENELVYISYVGSPLSAFGINIRKDKFIKILEEIKIDDNVTYKNNNLIIYTLNEIIYLNLEQVEDIDLNIPKIKCTIENIKDTYLYKILDKYEFEDHIGIDLGIETRTNIELLITKDKQNDFYNSKIINFFVGRGKGLTPSGDDILTGFTMGLMIFNNNGMFDKWIKDINLIVTKDKTTLVSVAYLKALTKGYVSENFLELILSIDKNSEKLVCEILDKIKFYGHTSGYDTMFGFYLSLKYLINN